MDNKKPHIANLRKRAKALGLVIVKHSTKEDIAMFGYTEYTLGKATDNHDKLMLLNLHGIMYQIEDIETQRGITA